MSRRIVAPEACRHGFARGDDCVAFRAASAWREMSSVWLLLRAAFKRHLECSPYARIESTEFVAFIEMLLPS
jgi:hypothetical protein